MKNIRTFLVTLAIAGLSVCIVKAQDAYLGGHAYDANCNCERAVVWKNGTPTYYTTESGDILSVVVDKGNVYVLGRNNISGWEYNIVWKNGIEIYRLDDGGAFAIAVSDGDIYAVGTKIESDTLVGRVWKNGTIQTGYTEARIFSSVFIDDDKNVYIGGYGKVEGIPSPIIWKNGTPLYTLTEDSNIQAVVVSDGDVYAAGLKGAPGMYIPVVWKNNDLLYTLGIGSPIYFNMDICISNGNIYVAGRNQDGRATLWKNGGAENGGQTISPCGDQVSSAYSVFVSGSKVYVAGTQENLFNGFRYAFIWINGQVTTFAAGSGANSVFVAPAGAGIAEAEDKSTVQVYPNPTSGILRIESGELRVKNVELFDVYGKEILSFVSFMFPETVINISHLPVGVYFAKITTETGEVIKKVLKE